MSGLKRAEAQRLLDASNGVTAYVNPTTPMKVKLTTTVPTSTASGTEVVGGSYPAGGIAVTWGAASAADPSVAVNSTSLSYTNMPACTVVGIDETDSAGSPRASWGGAITASHVVNAGDTVSIAASAISKTLGG